MRNTYLIFIFSLILFSCNQKQTDTSSHYCQNELNLLSTFDTIPTLQGNLKLINDSLDSKLAHLFKEDDICCQDLRFNIHHAIDSLESIKLSVNYYYKDKCDCPVFIRERNSIYIMQNSMGLTAIKGNPTNIDSIAPQIRSYYSKVGTSIYYPEKHKQLRFEIKWDQDVSQVHFSQFINQIILGYLRSVEDLSKTKYNKELCHLTKNELSELSKLIPLNIDLPVPVYIEDDLELELELELENE